MANKENTSDEGLRVSYDVKTYHEQKYIDYTLRLREILKHYHRLRKIISEL